MLFPLPGVDEPSCRFNTIAAFKRKNIMQIFVPNFPIVPIGPNLMCKIVVSFDGGPRIVVAEN